MKLPPAMAALGMVLCATAAGAADVKVDYDKGVDFSRFKTWSWRQGTAAPNPVSDKRLREAIEKRTYVRAGTVLLDMIDAASGKVVWRGQAKDVADPAYTDVARKIDGAMDELFKHFPPGKS
jgi:Domain of unknown function (DUF4136)